MSHSISKVGQLLNDHCEESSKAYQSSVMKAEEESRKTITKEVQINNTVTFIDNYMMFHSILVLWKT